jgi:uncharacterized protein YqgQ
MSRRSWVMETRTCKVSSSEHSDRQTCLLVCFYHLVSFGTTLWEMWLISISMFDHNQLYTCWTTTVYVYSLASWKWELAKCLHLNTVIDRHVYLSVSAILFHLEWHYGKCDWSRYWCATIASWKRELAKCLHLNTVIDRHVYLSVSAILFHLELHYEKCDWSRYQCLTITNYIHVGQHSLCLQSLASWKWELAKCLHLNSDSWF